MASVRVRQLVWLLGLFLVVWLGVTIATYLESRHEVEELFDAQLAQSAGVLAHFSTSNLDLSQIAEHRLEKDVYGHRYEKKIAFQIWQDGKLLLRSASAPLELMSDRLDFSDQKISGDHWRVFALQLEQSPKRIYVGERYEVRTELIEEITLNALYPLTLVLPLLVLLIWLGLGQGLAPVRRVASEVTQRSPDNLEPVHHNETIPREIRPLTDALNELFTRLSAAFERERRFTADAAHELRTPLASIKTQAQVALRAGSSEQQRHALQQIVAGVDRTAHLVEQLLTLARVDPDTASEKLLRVELRGIAVEMVALMTPEAHKKQIDLGLLDGPPGYILGHPAALTVLLRNLVDNAIRYTSEGGRVDVAIDDDGSQVLLRVTDTGPGIPAKERALVFERFYRGEDEQKIIGSGLGLSIVQRIAQLHRASLRLDTPPGHSGLTVEVVFASATPLAD